MKHLKLFENNNNEFWLVDYYIIEDNSHDYTLLPDEQSAENYIISLINDEKRNLDGENDIFIYVDDAINWYNNTFFDINITYEKIQLSSKIKLDDKIEKLRVLNKYNL